MILIGPAEVIPFVLMKDPENINVVNLTSLKEGLDKLNILPEVNKMYMDEKQFDFYFNSYIFENDRIFFEFFSKVMMPIYDGKNVFIAVNNDEESSVLQMVSYSFAKIIQCRYSYHCSFVNTPEDLEYVNVDETFTDKEAIERFDLDKERWTGLKASKMSLQEIVGGKHMEGIGYLDTYGVQ